MAEFKRIGSNAGQLTSVEEDYDRHSGIPRMSAVPVRVCRIDVLGEDALIMSFLAFISKYEIHRNMEDS